MTNAPFILAAAIEDLGVPTAPRNLLGMRAGDMLLIITVAVLLAVALIVWALYIRKPGEPSGRIEKGRTNVEERDDGTIRKRKKHRRPRRAHRNRNPTLSEAGGLPPLRDNSSSPPI